MELKVNSTFEEALKWASLFLDEWGCSNESARTYLLWIMDWTLTDFVRNQQETVDELTKYRIQDAFQRIVHDEPIQYIVGYADFMGHRFKVTPDTLIPREDTAGIVELASNYIKRQEKTNLKALDLGTGTGIIPITLKKRFHQLSVVAADISLPAISVARENAHTHQVDIEFSHSDLFEQINQVEKFDLILSNPPYISEDEQSLMDASVLKFEPHLALFAQHKGLFFYEQILKQSLGRVTSTGIILFEIGFKQGDSVVKLSQQYYPSATIQIHKDLNDLDRFVSIELRETKDEDRSI